MASKAEGRELKPVDLGREAATREDTEPAAAQGASSGIVVALAREAKPAGNTPIMGADQRLLDKQIQAAIGRHLRMMYNDIATAPVPDRFEKLLDELAAKADKS